MKVTTPAVRSDRCGHIDLRVSLVHPLSPGEESLGAIPVLPATLLESRRGQQLADVYDALIRSVASDSREGVVRSFDGIVELLLPVVVTAHDWNWPDTATLTFGLALVPRSQSNDEV